MFVGLVDVNKRKVTQNLVNFADVSRTLLLSSSEHEKFNEQL